MKDNSRQDRRTKEEIEKVFKKFLRTGKLPKKQISVTRIRKGKKVRIKKPNPDYIRDLRILQRRGLVSGMSKDDLLKELRYKKR